MAGAMAVAGASRKAERRSARRSRTERIHGLRQQGEPALAEGDIVSGSLGDGYERVRA